MGKLYTWFVGSILFNGAQCITKRSEIFSVSCFEVYATLPHNNPVIINYLNQLQPETLEHAIHYLIENCVDLSVFFPAYQDDTTGRARL